MGIFRRKSRSATHDAPVRDPRVGPDPVVDVNAPVANPELMAAIERRVQDESLEASEAMLVACARAVYLAPVFLSRMPEQREDGRTVLTEGTRIAFLSYPMPGHPDQSGFGVCTDQAAFDMLAPEGATAQIFTAPQAFGFALTDGRSGLIIHASNGSRMTLNRPECEAVQTLLGA